MRHAPISEQEKEEREEKKIKIKTTIKSKLPQRKGLHMVACILPAHTRTLSPCDLSSNHTTSSTRL